MNFFGVGVFEILLVLIIGLVILGPERLRDLGRQTGRLMARWLAWQQQSPELQMMQQVRREFEEEIVSLRDELVRAKISSTQKCGCSIARFLKRPER